MGGIWRGDGYWVVIRGVNLGEGFFLAITLLIHSYFLCSFYSSPLVDPYV